MVVALSPVRSGTFLLVHGLASLVRPSLLRACRPPLLLRGPRSRRRRRQSSFALVVFVSRLPGRSSGASCGRCALDSGGGHRVRRAPDHWRNRLAGGARRLGSAVDFFWDWNAAGCALHRARHGASGVSGSIGRVGLVGRVGQVGAGRTGRAGEAGSAIYTRLRATTSHISSPSGRFVNGSIRSTISKPALSRSSRTNCGAISCDRS